MQQHGRERGRARDCIMVYPLQWQAVACRLWGFYGCGKGQEVTQISSDIIFLEKDISAYFFPPHAVFTFIHFDCVAPLQSGEYTLYICTPLPCFCLWLSGTESMTMVLQGLHSHRSMLVVVFSSPHIP